MKQVKKQAKDCPKRYRMYAGQPGQMVECGGPSQPAKIKVNGRWCVAPRVAGPGEIVPINL